MGDPYDQSWIHSCIEPVSLLLIWTQESTGGKIIHKPALLGWFLILMQRALCLPPWKQGRCQDQIDKWINAMQSYQY